ncbi:hypothetical protein [Deinococcus cavernae]|uniref:hypothetical protein n=1 Tax=Deinococcus cavernae TaxID=2320857 RepID=UPI0011C23CCD|nr:hypothetical protein [Deinococcus cavernae]
MKTFRIASVIILLGSGSVQSQANAPVNSYNDLASALFRMGSMPDSLVVFPNRKRGEPMINTWRTPEIGKVVQSTWNSSFVWTIKITEPKFKIDDLGKIESVDKNKKLSKVTSGPLKGVIVQQQASLRLMSQQWYLKYFNKATK